MNKYSINKALARQKAIDFQNESSYNNYSYEELAEKQRQLETIGKRFGLLKEFRENNII